VSVFEEDLALRVLSYCKRKSLFEKGRKGLLAVSGGSDSVFLLHVLNRFKGQLGLEICVGHVDHQLRKSSKEDAEFVRGLAQGIGVQFYLKTADVRGYAKNSGKTIEESAREMRYRLLFQIKEESGSDYVVTGHTATDQAETVLFRLLRGSGLLGLSGVELKDERGIRRPLLCVTRDEVRGFLQKEGIAFREDESNIDKRFTRNRIRLDVLPLLKNINPRVEFALCEIGEDARQIRDLVSTMIEGGFQIKENEVFIPRGEVTRLGEALLPYALLDGFHRLTGRPFGLLRRHIQGVLRIAFRKEKAMLKLPRRVTVFVDKHGITLKRQ